VRLLIDAVNQAGQSIRVAHAPRIIDTRNALKAFSNDKIVR
jgi:hypothetical protein